MDNALIISKDKNKIDFAKVVNYLQNESYWAKNRKREIILKSIDNSLCYSLLLNNEFIGFGRVITDYCTFAYLCDLFILPEYQNRKYGHKLMEFILDDAEIKTARFFLLTQTARNFYKKFGFMNEEGIQKRVMYRWQ